MVQVVFKEERKVTYGIVYREYMLALQDENRSGEIRGTIEAMERYHIL